MIFLTRNFKIIQNLKSFRDGLATFLGRASEICSIFFRQSWQQLCCCQAQRTSKVLRILLTAVVRNSFNISSPPQRSRCFFDSSHDSLAYEIHTDRNINKDQFLRHIDSCKNTFFVVVAQPLVEAFAMRFPDCKFFMEDFIFSFNICV